MHSIPVYADNGPDEATAKKWLAEIAPHFKEPERQYLARWVKKIEYTRLPAGLGGYYQAHTQTVGVGNHNEPHSVPLMDMGGLAHRRKRTMAHELAHPVYALAAQDGIAGFLIINPEMRKRAQARARDLFPDAISEVENALAEGKITQFRPTGYSQQAVLAMQAYAMLDERYYDTFGSGRRFGYSKPNRNHEIACNLRALEICEAETPGQGVVRQIAGEVLDSLEQKVANALQKPDRSPFLEPKKPGTTGVGAG